VLSISAVRRTAALSGSFTRYVTSYNVSYDSVSGRWDSTRVVRSVGDSAGRAETERWAETQASVAWEGRRVSAELAMGGRLASRGVPRGVWASGDVAVRLSTPLSLVLGAGSSTGGRFALDAERRFVTLGLRISPHLTSTLVAARPVTSAAGVSTLTIDAVGAGQYRLAVTAPRAHRVEISGDFTGWKPVALERDGQRWMLTLRLAAGTHRLNVRVDGGSWIAPPGLTTMSDDFAGEVGVLVIEAPRTREDATK